MLQSTAESNYKNQPLQIIPSDSKKDDLMYLKLKQKFSEKS